MKKSIRIKLVGFWENFNPDNNIIFQIIKRHFNVEYVDDDPDYIFCSCIGNYEYYEYCKYPQIRIMYSGENYIPDFNLIDYAISSYPVIFLDRHFRLPEFVQGRTQLSLNLEKKEKSYDKSFLSKKEYFANFICSHESEFNIRGDFFKKLSEYKRIESCGTYLNNMENGFVVNQNEKLQFQKKCKFTLCFESTSHDGFITEKIIDAFAADTIPVYYGSRDIDTIFNKEAFINCLDYDNFDQVIAKIIELDNDDEKYLKMLNKPVFVKSNYVSETLQGLEEFLFNIFNQSKKVAFRRSLVYSAGEHNDYLIKCNRLIDEDNLKRSLNKSGNSNITKRLKGKLSKFKFYQILSRIKNRIIDSK